MFFRFFCYLAIHAKKPRRLSAEAFAVLVFQIHSCRCLDVGFLRTNAELLIQVASHRAQHAVLGAVQGVESTRRHSFYILCELARLALIINCLLSNRIRSIAKLDANLMIIVDAERIQIAVGLEHGRMCRAGIDI